MEYRVFDNHIVLRLDPMDEVLTCIKDVCIKEDVALATVSGIGAVNHIEGGLFDPVKKAYRPSVFDGFYELASLVGNISRQNGEPYLHIHATWSDEHCNAFGGHLNNAVISVTSEIIIQKIAGTVGRRFNEELGLNVLDF